MGYMHVGGRGVAAPPAGSGGAPGSAHYAFNGSPIFLYTYLTRSTRSMADVCLTGAGHHVAGAKEDY